MTRRRRFVAAAAALSALGVPGALLRAQPAPRTLRLGLLGPASAGPGDLLRGALERAFAQRGYAVGQSLVIDDRFRDDGDASAERLAQKARALAHAHADLIVAAGTLATRAAREATNTIPILMLGRFDPIASGFVPTLERPLGNVTGVVVPLDRGLDARRLELLREALPQVRRFGLLSGDDPDERAETASLSGAAATLGFEPPVQVTLPATPGQQPDDAAFESLVSSHAQALWIGSHDFSSRRLDRLLALALRHKLPAFGAWPEQARAGAMLAYGPTLAGMCERVAVQAERLFLRGTRPRDLPVQVASDFQLSANSKTARALGLELPQGVIVRAQEVVR